MGDNVGLLVQMLAVRRLNTLVPVFKQCIAIGWVSIGSGD